MTYAQRFAEAALRRNKDCDERMRIALWSAVDVEDLSFGDGYAYPPMPGVVAQQVMKQSSDARDVVAWTCDDPQLLDKLARKGLVKLRRYVAGNPACSTETAGYLWQIVEEKHDYQLQGALTRRYGRMARETPLEERGELIARFAKETDEDRHIHRVVDSVCRITTYSTEDVDEQVRHLGVLYDATPRPYKFEVISWMLAHAPVTTEMATLLWHAIEEHVEFLAPSVMSADARAEAAATTTNSRGGHVPVVGQEFSAEIPINARLHDQEAFVDLLNRFPNLKSNMRVLGWEPNPLKRWHPALIELVLRDGRPRCVIEMLNSHPQVVNTLTADEIRFALERAAEIHVDWQSRQLIRFVQSYVSQHVKVDGDNYAAVVAMIEASTTDLLTTVRSLQLTFGKP